MTITISEERGVRFLHFGTPWIQGAMRIARPYALELDYTRDLMAPLLFRPSLDWPARVLQIGLGAGSVTKFLHRHRTAAKVTVVEIDPAVVAAARHYFRLPEEDARLRIVIGDGAELVAEKEQRYDLVVIDGFDDHGRAGMLESEPFYLNCRRRLTGTGLMSVNLLTRTRGVKPVVDRLRQAFEGRVVVLPPSEAGNTVVLATAGDPLELSFGALRKTASKLKESTGLDLAPLLARLEQAGGADHFFRA
jgi:spermidine synthase